MKYYFDIHGNMVALEEPPCFDIVAEWERQQRWLDLKALELSKKKKNLEHKFQVR